MMDLLGSDMSYELGNQLERRNSDGDLGKRTLSNASQCSRGRRNTRLQSSHDDTTSKANENAKSNSSAILKSSMSYDSSVSSAIIANGSTAVVNGSAVAANGPSVSAAANGDIKISALIFEKLKMDLERAQAELRKRDDECRNLSRVRDDLDVEVEDLTASLFEEAHKLVREANIKRHTAEMKYKEINMKVEGLQAEVSALKMLVITSTPSNPGKKGHRRMASVDQICTECGTCHTVTSESQDNGCWAVIDTLDQKEVDVVVFKEFLSWLEARSPFQNHPFIDRIWSLDIKPCLTFPNEELGNAVLDAITNNTLILEPVKGKLKPKKCALAKLMLNCPFRMKTNDDAEWCAISQGCHAKIVSVGSLCTYLRYIQQGLVKKEVTVMYWDVVKKRGEVSLARLGLQKSSHMK